MKALITLTMLLFGTFSYANESVLDGIEKLPRLFNTKLTVDHGPAMAAVQPTAHVNFTYASCAAKKFFVELEDIGEVILVKIKLVPNQIECRAMPYKRNYSIQISSDFGSYSKRVVVLNPIDEDSKYYRQQ